MFFFAIFNPFYVPWWAQERRQHSSTGQTFLGKVVEPCKLSCRGATIYNFWSRDSKYNPSGKIATTGAICLELRNAWREDAKKRCQSGNI